MSARAALFPLFPQIKRRLCRAIAVPIDVEWRLQRSFRNAVAGGLTVVLLTRDGCRRKPRGALLKWIPKMTANIGRSLDKVLERLPLVYPGPGGAVAVLREGRVVAKRVWGWANAERRLPFTSKTLFRTCSITKQFTCALLLDELPDLTVLDTAAAAQLPLLQQQPPTALNLCHNQSGLRDYWMVATLHGAAAESSFGETEARKLIGGTRTLHFDAGTQYSYANQNFRILSNAFESHAGRSYAEALKARIFDRVGMSGAIYSPDTRAVPDGTEGYEGDQVAGFRAARNGSVWTGDGGIVAGLDDIIAWERYIDATRDDAKGLYTRLAQPVFYADGSRAGYGFGLNRRYEFGRDMFGHSGSLRGWHMHRLNVPSERISIVVMFNHMAEPFAAAMDLCATILGCERPRIPTSGAAPFWLGGYCDPETGSAARVDMRKGGKVRLRFGQSAQMLDVQEDGTAANEHTRLRFTEDGLWIDRLKETRSFLLRPSEINLTSNLTGRYRCEELDAELTIIHSDGGVVYGSFSGFLGQERMELLDPIALDTWTLPCPRALDYAPPGDWTLAFQRDAAGRVFSVSVGCWRARGLTYDRVD